MKSVITFVSLFLLFGTAAFGQSLKGTVVDSIGGQGIPGAIVYFPELKIGTTTDSVGNFKMTTMPKGTYEMEVKILGYSTLTQQVTIKENEVCTCNCKMGASCCSSNEVIITAL